MRIFRYWVRRALPLDLGDRTVEVHCYGGSNESPEAAEQDASQRLTGLYARVRGASVDASYQADIREEPLLWIDSANAVTRNRYGAEVLNSTDHMFVDVDQPRYRFWELFSALFPARGDLLKQRILAFLRRRAAAPDLAGRSLRLYETHKGIRVLVGGPVLAPASKAAQKLMQGLNSDWLYATLCRRQGCFRARLTPKPHRMKVRGMRVSYPRDEAQEDRFQEWRAGYDARRGDFATCRYLCTLGPEWDSAVIRYHDERSGAFSGLPLA